jgi:hypothetical protein
MTNWHLALGICDRELLRTRALRGMASSPTGKEPAPKGRQILAQRFKRRVREKHIRVP